MARNVPQSKVSPTPNMQAKSANPFANESLLGFMKQSNGRGDSRWYYKDPNGRVQGPFTQHQMAEWYDFGYFQDDLEIAFGENSMFLPLQKYKDNT
jgi:hypothetical protein